MRWAWAVGLAAILTACATPEERVQRAQVALDRTCQGYGFKPGTDGYRNCWMQVDQANQRRTSGTTVCQGIGSGFVCN